MPPRQNTAKPVGKPSVKPRRSTRQAARGNNLNNSSCIPDVFQDMLDEAAAASNDDFAVSPRPLKMRKVMSGHAEIDDLFESPPANPPPAKVEDEVDAVVTSARPQQVVYDDFEESDESDVEFEDIELEAATASTEDESIETRPLQIDLSKSVLEASKRTVQRRKPVTKAERLMRLDVHKWHLLSLIGHGLQRNAWCNNQDVHSILRPSVPRKIIKLLHADDTRPMYERNYSFTKGIEEICDLWHHRWKTTIQGLRRSHWREGVNAVNELDDSEDIEFEDFLSAAQSSRGSRDLGAQLFTALLRSIAVEARLVFSLQVLPFTAAAKVDISAKPRPDRNYIRAPPQNYSAASSIPSAFASPVSRPKKYRRIVDSPFPIFWTEVLTPNQTWSPIDPIVRSSIGKPKTQFEPPLADQLNSMTYVIAYEDGNSARDVTRRYARWFNAKTRRTRVEGTRDGELWYASVLHTLRKTVHEPRDQVEDEELARRANSEGMPNSIQDFKSHPVYVLERHMRANEVLQPRREVGKVNTGTSKSGNIESVYRRQDVHLCRTADAWYRRGRDINMGEQPLKHVLPKSRRADRAVSAEVSDNEDEDEGEREGVGLYAEYQTSVYEPPPVVGGRIPKNAYGNLDLYVPSMIPPGAVHISHPLASSAAKVVGVDFADAVTGFDFKGRQGTAVINGIVVAQQYTAAISAVIGSLESLGSEEVQQTRSRILLNVWKRLLQALRVREKIEAEYGSSNASRHKTIPVDEDEDSEYEEEGGNDEIGGGFMMEDEATEEKVQEQVVSLQAMKSKMPTLLPEEVSSTPIMLTISPHRLPVEEEPVVSTNVHVGNNDELFNDDTDCDKIDDAGGFTAGDSDDDDTNMAGGFTVDEDDEQDQGGGFLPASDDEFGGRFMSENSPQATLAQSNKVVQPQPTSLQSRTKSRSSHDGAFSNNLFTSTKLPPKHQHRSTSQSTQPTQGISDTVHSDAEEESLLQIAIIESLAAQTSTPVPRPNSDLAATSSNLATSVPTTNTTNVPHKSTANTPFAMTSDIKPDLAPEEKTQVNPAEAETETNSTVSRRESLSSTSLLSHDPNEDDDDPEWLDEALDQPIWALAHLNQHGWLSRYPAVHPGLLESNEGKS